MLRSQNVDVNILNPLTTRSLNAESNLKLRTIKVYTNPLYAKVSFLFLFRKKLQSYKNSTNHEISFNFHINK